MSSIPIAVDWQALSAIAGALVFVATLTLAIATWRLARAARDQVAAAERQADASGRLADIARRQLEVGSSAAFRVVRADNVNLAKARLIPRDEGGWGREEPAWTVEIYNTGEATAVTEPASVLVPGGGRRTATLDPDRAVKPSEHRTLVFASINESMVERASGRSGAEWNITLPYREPGSTELRKFYAALRLRRNREGDWRWTVLREGVT